MVKLILGQISQLFYLKELFLIYINNLTEDLSSNSKLFAEDTALFSFVRYKNLKAKDLNENLQEISNWVIQWKMNFHPDPPKEA